MSAEAWLEVSLIVDGEMAEAVSEVLAGFVSGGVVIESTEIADAFNGEGRVVGPLRVCGYLRADDQLDAERQRLEVALWHLGQIQPLPQLEYKPIDEADWSQVWKQHFHPVPIGSRLFIIPNWMEVESGARIVIRINPGMAFGTGTHPTTQLCLEIMEDHLGMAWSESRTGDNSRFTMIDIGCGSGILGIAAAKLGVSHILGVDLDPAAIGIARQNSALNDVGENFELSTGSIAEIKAGAFSIRNAPLVTVNILAPVILKLLEAGLCDLVEAPGSLVLSGILEEHSGEVEAAVRRSGMRMKESRQLGDWMALLVEKLS